MPKPSPLIVLLVIAAALADSAIQRSLDPQSCHELVKGLALGCVLAQATWLTVWLVFGRCRFTLRLAAVVAAATILARLAAPTTRWTDWNQWLGVLLLFGLVLATPLFALRALGVRLVRDSSEPQRPTSELPARGRQFSLGAIVIWITGFCVVLGFVRGWGFPWDHGWEASIHCMGFALVAAMALAAVFRDGNRTIRLATVVFASLAIGWLLGRLGAPWHQVAAIFSARPAADAAAEGPGSLCRLVAAICGTQALLVGLGAWVVRIGGFRFGRAPEGQFEQR